MNIDKKNIVMIVIWFMVFFGMVFFLVSMIPIMNFSIFHIVGVLFAIFYIGASLYYLNKRIILGGLK